MGVEVGFEFGVDVESAWFGIGFKFGFEVEVARVLLGFKFDVGVGFEVAEVNVEFWFGH